MLSQLVKPEVQAFILEHTGSDLTRLLLNKNKYPTIPMDLVVDQIRAREKAKHKIPLWVNTEGVVMPPLLSMEQCSSEQTATYKASLFGGKTCVDLTGGTGVDTYCLSKRFNEVHYIEQNHQLAEIARYNFELLGARNIIVHTKTSEQFLADFNLKVDLIYIDPSRRDQQNKVFNFELCSPNVLPMQNELLQRAEKVMVKASPMIDISLGIKQLLHVTRIHVVALKNEVKELLFVQQNKSSTETLIKAIDLSIPGPFEFIHGSQNAPDIAPVKKYLYEPNAAIMKSGGVNWLSHHYPIQKLHENTHLFTSNTLIASFPGRSFKIESVVKYNKKEIRRAVTGSKANVSVRNFPDTVDTFRKKTGLRSGGEIYVFGYTGPYNNVEIAICKKVLFQEDL